MMWLALVLITLFFSYKSAIFLDPDFGWQLKTGEIILEKGFPYTDQFSYTLPNFPVVAHEWFSQTLFAALFPIIGYTGLSILTGLTAGLSIIILLDPARNYWKEYAIPLIFASAMLFPYLGVRPQVFSWLFFSIFALFFFNKHLWQKYYLFTPFVIWIWAQMHGSFPLGLVVLVVLGYTKPQKHSVAVLTTSFLVTLINPYGFSLWREVLLTFFHPSVRLGINEWEPLLSQISFIHLPIIAVSYLFIVRYREKYARAEIILFIGAFLLALSSGKLFPYWILAAALVMQKGLAIVRTEIGKQKAAKKRYDYFLYALLALAALLAFVHVPTSIQRYKNISESNYYPKGAVRYLKEHPPQDNIFSTFGWGGYLIWKYPEKKVFIDGRMPYWDGILEEYYFAVRGESDLEALAQKHNIEVVLVPSNDPKFGKFKKQLMELSWTAAYSDRVSTILTRPGL